MKNKVNIKKYKSFFIVTLISILAMIGDFVTTYMYTPDLSMEANPLVTLFGSGWMGLLAANAVVLAVFMFLAYFPFVYYKRSVFTCKGFREYVSMLYFGTPNEFKRILFKNPKEKLFILVPIGYAYVIGDICVRICTDIMTILALKECYPCLFCFLKLPHTICNMIILQTSKGQLIIPIVSVALYILVILIAFCQWHIKEYRMNKKETEAAYGK